MESEQNTLTPQSERIQQEIKEISQHEHVKSIQKVDTYAYRIQYRPFKTHSPYKDRTYNLLLTLSKTYPNDPPTLKFLKQIYHLNVDIHSGEIRMAVLEDDWSPFLSLTSLMESLDKILEEPDQDYAINTDVLEAYQHHRQKYLNKVLENVSLSDIAICNTDIKQFLSYSQNGNSAELSPIKINHQQQIKQPNKIKQSQSKNSLLRKAKELSQNLKESVEFQVQSENQQKRLQNRMSGCQYNERFGEKVQNQISNDSAKLGKLQTQKGMGSNKDIVKMEISQSIKQPQYQNNQSKNYKASNCFGIPLQNHQNVTLQRISQTISIFIEELHQLEQLMVSSKNLGIKAMLKDKYNNQLQMLKQLMEMSEQAKKKMIEQFKDEVNRM